MPPARVDRRQVVAAGALQGPLLVVTTFVVVGAFQLLFFDRWLALLDEGYILAIADAVRRGKMLYRDIRVEDPFPAAFQLLAWWFSLVGVSVRASRWLVVAGFATFAAALVHLTRKAMGQGAAIACVAFMLVYRVFAFPHWHVFSYSLVAATLATLAALLVGASLRGGSPVGFTVAGLVAGLAIAAKQDYGLGVTGALGVAILAVPWLRPRRSFADSVIPAMTFAAGPVLVIGAIIAWYWAHGALDAFVDQTVRFPLLATRKAVYATLPAPWPLVGQDTALRAELASYFPSILA